MIDEEVYEYITDLIARMKSLSQEFALASLFALLDEESYELFYLLDEHGNPVPTRDDLAAHRLLCDVPARTVAKTYIVFRDLLVEISTVFMVYNHALLRGRAPVLWETMIFAEHADLHGLQARYHSRSEAERGHRKMVQRVWRTLIFHASLKKTLKARRKRGTHVSNACIEKQIRGIAEHRHRAVSWCAACHQ